MNYGEQPLKSGISIGMGGPISEGKPSGPAPAIKAVRVPKPPTHVVMWTPEPDPNAKYMNDTWDDDKVAFVTFGDAYHPASPLLPIAAADVVTLDFIRWHSSIMSHDYGKRLTGVKTMRRADGGEFHALPGVGHALENLVDFCHLGGVHQVMANLHIPEHLENYVLHLKWDVSTPAGDTLRICFPSYGSRPFVWPKHFTLVLHPVVPAGKELEDYIGFLNEVANAAYDILRSAGTVTIVGLDEVPPETLNIWEEDDLHKWRVEVIRRSFCSTWGSCAHSRRPDDWYTPKEGKEEEEEQLGIIITQIGGPGVDYEEEQVVLKQEVYPSVDDFSEDDSEVGDRREVEPSVDDFDPLSEDDFDLVEHPVYNDLPVPLPPPLTSLIPQVHDDIIRESDDEEEIGYWDDWSVRNGREDAPEAGNNKFSLLADHSASGPQARGQFVALSLADLVPEPKGTNPALADIPETYSEDSEQARQLMREEERRRGIVRAPSDPPWHEEQMISTSEYRPRIATCPPRGRDHDVDYDSHSEGEDEVVLEKDAIVNEDNGEDVGVVEHNDVVYEDVTAHEDMVEDGRMTFDPTTTVITGPIAPPRPPIEEDALEVVHRMLEDERRRGIARASTDPPAQFIPVVYAKVAPSQDPRISVDPPNVTVEMKNDQSVAEDKGVVVAAEEEEKEEDGRTIVVHTTTVTTGATTPSRPPAIEEDPLQAVHLMLEDERRRGIVRASTDIPAQPPIVGQWTPSQDPRISVHPPQATYVTSGPGATSRPPIHIEENHFRAVEPVLGSPAPRTTSEIADRIAASWDIEVTTEQVPATSTELTEEEKVYLAAVVDERRRLLERLMTDEPLEPKIRPGRNISAAAQPSQVGGWRNWRPGMPLTADVLDPKSWDSGPASELTEIITTTSLTPVKSFDIGVAPETTEVTTTTTTVDAAKGWGIGVPSATVEETTTTTTAAVRPDPPFEPVGLNVSPPRNIADTGQPPHAGILQRAGFGGASKTAELAACVSYGPSDNWGIAEPIETTSTTIKTTVTPSPSATSVSRSPYGVHATGTVGVPKVPSWIGIPSETVKETTTVTTTTTTTVTPSVATSATRRTRRRQASESSGSGDDDAAPSALDPSRVCTTCDWPLSPPHHYGDVTYLASSSVYRTSDSCLCGPVTDERIAEQPAVESSTSRPAKDRFGFGIQYSPYDEHGRVAASATPERRHYPPFVGSIPSKNDVVEQAVAEAVTSVRETQPASVKVKNVGPSPLGQPGPVYPSVDPARPRDLEFVVVDESSEASVRDGGTAEPEDRDGVKATSEPVGATGRVDPSVTPAPKHDVPFVPDPPEWSMRDRATATKIGSWPAGATGPIASVERTPSGITIISHGTVARGPDDIDTAPRAVVADSVPIPDYLEEELDAAPGVSSYPPHTPPRVSSCPPRFPPPRPAGYVTPPPPKITTPAELFPRVQFRTNAEWRAELVAAGKDVAVLADWPAYLRPRVMKAPPVPQPVVEDSEDEDVPVTKVPVRYY